MTGKGDTESPVALNAYAATRCAYRTWSDFHVDAPFLVPPSEAAQRRAEAGRNFEAEVLASLKTVYGDDLLMIEANSVSATIHAMAEGQPLIAGGSLEDTEGRRVGRPDLLVRTSARDADRHTYAPVDIKSHLFTEAGKDGVSVSKLDGLAPLVRTQVAETKFRSDRYRSDGLQLVHYQKMLQTLGSADDMVGVLSTEGCVWWLDPNIARSKNEPSLVEEYDSEFELRLLASDHSDCHADVVVTQFRKSECETCDWTLVCDADFRQRDDVSLVKGLTAKQIQALRRAGIGDRSSLAQLDWRSAAAMFGYGSNGQPLPVSSWMGDTAHLDDSPVLADVVKIGSPKRAEHLATHGIRTVGDLRALDSKVVQLEHSGITRLADIIDLARVSIADRPFIKRNRQPAQVPVADIEVDIDMEDYGGSVYLWGAYVTKRGHEGKYHPFVSWDTQHEVETFTQFWNWLLSLEATTTARGQTFRAFCYTHAENRMIKRLLESASPDIAARISAFVESDRWHDLHRDVTDNYLWPNGAGLKKVALHCGFSWRDNDPGGDQSMVWFENAVGSPDAAEREAQRRRLLEYNEDDVKATVAIRQWLLTSGQNVVRIENASLV